MLLLSTDQMMWVSDVVGSKAGMKRIRNVEFGNKNPKLRCGSSHLSPKGSGKTAKMLNK